MTALMIIEMSSIRLKYVSSERSLNRISLYLNDFFVRKMIDRLLQYAFQMVTGKY